MFGRKTGERARSRGARHGGRAARTLGPRFGLVALLVAVAAIAVLAPGTAQGSGELGTPSSVSISRGDGTVSASWPSVSGATHYHVTYSTDGGGSWHAPVDGHRNITSTGLTFSADNSKTYIVGVRAGNDGGWGGWRNSSSSGPYKPPTRTPTPKPTPTPEPTPEPDPTPDPPGTPSSVSISRGDGTVTASWDALSGATHYHVTYSTDGGGSWHAPVDNHTNITSTSLTFSAENAKTYMVGVRGGNEGGWGGWRNSSSSGPYTPAPDPTPTPTPDPTPTPPATTTPPINPPATTTPVNPPATSTPVTPPDSPATSTPVAPALSFGDAAVADQSWFRGLPIATLTLPAATGGNGTTTYSLVPTLPAGLSFDAAARTIGGTPTATSTQAAYYYTATDGTDTAMLSFSIEVTEGLVSAQGGQAQAGLSWVTSPPTLLEWTQGVAVNVTLPAATGDPNITYKLSQGCGSTGAQLPPGITWNASTRTLSGTPTKWFATRAACYQAYASNKSTPSVTIHIRVADTSGNHAPYASIKSSGSQLLGQLWSKYGHCYSGSVTYVPSSGHSKHFYDPEDDTLTFTAGSNKLVGTTINSNGYVVASLRHPPLNWYSFHYTATDPDGLYDSISLQVKHFNCKETLSVQENKPKDTVVGSVGGPNKADGSSFSLGGDVATYFDIDSSTGQITVKDGTTLDYETKTSYSGNFRYTVENTSVGGNIQINVNDVRAPNVDRPTLAQNSTNPTTALDVSWTAPTPMTGTTINDYDVRYREWTTSTWTEWNPNSTSTATSATITGLTAGKEYEVQVRSQIVDEGPGHWSGSSVILYLAENTAVNGNVGGKFNINATDYYPLQFTLGGTDGSKFKLSTDTGYKTAQSAQIQVKTGNVPDFESKSSYSLTLRAVENNLNRNILDVTYSALIIVTDVAEPPGKPTVTVAGNSTTPTTKLDVSWTAPTMTGKPAISDYDVQYRKTGDSTWSSHSFTGTGTSVTLSSLTAGKKYDVQVRAVNDEGNGAWSDTGNAITQSASVTRSVAENTAASGNVGAAVTMTAGSYTLAHSLDGTDKDKFEIGSTTGQITVKTGNVPDYEAKTSYSVEVKIAVSGTGNSNSEPNGTGTYTVPVTINVTDVNEPPPKLSAPTVAANSTTPTSKIDVSWTAPTTTQMSGKPAVDDYDVRYKKAGDSTWTETSDNTKSTTLSATLSGLTSGKTYEVQVRAGNVEGDGDWSATSTAITQAGGVSRSVAENSAANTLIRPAVTATTSTKYTYTHTLSGTDSGKFILDSSTGYLRVGSNTSLDYETKTSYSVIVTVTAAAKSQGGANAQSLDPNAPGDYAVPVTINVADVNEAPEFSSATTTRSIAENSAAGSAVGAAVTATDPDGVAKFNTLTYSLTGTDAAQFEIGSGTGQITVKSGTNLDYEAKTSYSVTVSVTDGKNASGTADTSADDTIAVTINVTDVSEPPPKMSAPTVTGKTSTSIDVSWTKLTGAQMSGKPAVTAQGMRYRAVGDSTWTTNWGALSATVESTTIIGRTPGKTYEVQVASRNAEGDGAWSDSGTAITEAGGVTRSIAENSAAGANVGAAVTAVSTNTTYTYSHALSGTDAGKFEIGSGTGQITVKSGTSLDYEAKTSYSVVVTVTAAAKSQGANAQSVDPNAPGDYVVPVTINVTDVAEPPAAPDTPSMWQHSPSPKTQLDVSWTAPDMTGKPAITDYDIQYKKTATSTWSAWAHAGTETTAKLTGLDEGTRYEVQVKAKNDEGGSGWSVSGTATTQDKNVHSEFPGATSTRSIAENSAAGTNVGAPVTASDTEGHTLYYSLIGPDGGKFDVGLNTGQITVKTGHVPNYEAKTTYSVTVQVSDRKDTDDNPDTVIDDTIEVTINVTDVAEPPAAPSAPTVAANSATPESKIDVSWTAPDMTGKPAISDYDVRYRLSGASNWTDHSFTGTGTNTTLTGLDAGKSYDVQVRATNDEGTGAWSASGTAITMAGGVARSVAENTAAGTGIGEPVTATTTSANYTYSHALSGTDAASFDIDSSTGQVKVKAALDYETKTGYSVIVTVTAASAGANAQSQTLTPNAPGDYVVPVTITVTDVNEAPEFVEGDSAARSAAENSTAGTAAGAPVTATDQDKDTLTYSLTGTDAAKFDIATSTGQIKVKSALDYEAKTSYSVTVNVTDSKDDSGNPDTTIDDTIAITINVTDVNEPPPAPDGPSVSQNSASRTTRLDVSWSAPDMTGKPDITDYDVRYKIATSTVWSSHNFTGTGTATTLTGLDKGTRYEVQVRAVNHEGDGAWSTSGSNRTQDLKSATLSVDENTTGGTAVSGSLPPVDSEGHSVVYTMTGNTVSTTTAQQASSYGRVAAARQQSQQHNEFSVNSQTGQVIVNEGANLDYEQTHTHVITITASHADSSNPGHNLVNAVYTVTITIGDVNEPPAAPGTPTLKENTYTSLTATWTEPDMTGKPAIEEYSVAFWPEGHSECRQVESAGSGNEIVLDSIVNCPDPEDTPLRAGRGYELEVRARNAEGYSAWSSTATLYTKAKPAPDVPDAPTATTTPTVTPTPSPTPTATTTPTATPTPVPTASPTPAPTATPAPAPTASPTAVSTATPAPAPTATPTAAPAAAVTATPTPEPTPSPTPTPEPTPELSLLSDETAPGLEDPRRPIGGDIVRNLPVRVLEDDAGGPATVEAGPPPAPTVTPSAPPADDRGGYTMAVWSMLVALLAALLAVPFLFALRRRRKRAESAITVQTP